VASLKDLANSVDVVVVSVSPDIIKKIGSPYITGVIPANTYKGQAENVSTAAIGNFLVTHKDVSTETVYQMTKLVFESLPELVAAHAAAKDIDIKKATVGMPVPLHPGAQKYFKEKGIIK